MANLLATELIRDIPDFPKPGIIFKDITPVLKHPKAFAEIIEKMLDFAEPKRPDVILGIESRGFIFGAPLALEMDKSFAPIRKVGKLPHDTIQAEYSLEYGTNTVEMHRDAVTPGQKVLIVDDLLATGGTAAASAHLVKQLGAEVVGMVFLIELDFLKGREKLQGFDVKSFIVY